MISTYVTQSRISFFDYYIKSIFSLTFYFVLFLIIIAIIVPGPNILEFISFIVFFIIPTILVIAFFAALKMKNHLSQYDYSIELKQDQINIKYTKLIFPYIKNRNIQLSILYKDILKIKPVSNNPLFFIKTVLTISIPFYSPKHHIQIPFFPTNNCTEIILKRPIEYEPYSFNGHPLHHIILCKLFPMHKKYSSKKIIIGIAPKELSCITLK